MLGSRRALRRQIATTVSVSSMLRVAARLPIGKRARVLIVGECAPGIRGALRRTGCKPSSGPIDIDAPWSAPIPGRYDLAVAAEAMTLCRAPAALLSRCATLAPAVLVVLDVVEGDGVVRCRDGRSVFGDAWIAEQAELLDLSVEQERLDSPGSRAVVRHGDESHTEVRARTELCVFRRRCDRATPLLVHVHVPKTAGQSFNELLDCTVAKGRMVYFYPGEPSKARWDVVARLVNEEPQPRVLSLHAARLYLPPKLGARLPLYVGMVREPYAQVASYLRYVRQAFTGLTEAHRKLLPERCPEMSFEELLEWHLENRSWMEFGGLFLPVSWMTERPDLERAKQLFGRFLVVGITEQIERSVRVLAHELEPYGFDLGRQVPLRNATVRDDARGELLREHDGFLRRAKRFMDVEESFYRWAVERFEGQARAVGL